ncbi:MAG TPA: cytochrome c oxidase subunit II [Stellaceae bacterium]|nr:cytochrome c oxidase subunit II [Stellaceae bacterium]
MFHGSTYSWIPFWPPTASNTGNVVNSLFVAETALAFAILATVIGLISTYLVLYRRGTAFSRADRVKKTWHFEIGWTTATFLLFFVAFVWGASIYIWMYQTPRGDLEVYAVGKQWMWKFQHPGGQREINTLHVPVGKKVRVVIASQDVIHSLFIPAFRLKRDAVPGTYETMWFKADKTGTYMLECSEYCGTEHAHMRGEIVVMSVPDYTNWLRQRGVHDSLAQEGEQLFRAHGCSGCHGANSTVHAPSLVGIYGTYVHLQDGSVRYADEAYLRDCILRPRSFTVAGYPPIMPDFSGQLSEDDLIKLIEYIRSLSAGNKGSVR